MTNSRIPNEVDWGVISDDDLDLRAAHEDFFGKSNAEMQDAFSRYVIGLSDSLRWMPSVPFQYYICGFADFVINGKYDTTDAPDVASTFMVLVEEKLNEQPNVILPVMDKLLPVITHIAANQSVYGADIDIYGDFSETKSNIEKLLYDQK